MGHERMGGIPEKCVSEVPRKLGLAVLSIMGAICSDLVYIHRTSERFTAAGIRFNGQAWAEPCSF